MERTMKIVGASNHIKLGSLFSGIGGFELGLERAIPGLETVWQVEQEPFCQKVLKKHWPNATIYNDVRDVNKNNVEPVDILCGGFPCQDISLAGKGEGLNGKKSGLWWEMQRIISELRPRIAVMENVPAITFRGLDSVLGSLSEIGYDAEWCIISAKDFGAPHLRKRWFCVAHPHGNGIGEKNKIRAGRPPSTICDRSSNVTNANGASIKRNGLPVRTRSKRTELNIQIQNYWERFPSQPPLRDRNDGIPNRLARLRALGNAIVPQCSEWIGKQILNSGLLEGVE